MYDVHMLRKTFYISLEQNNALELLKGASVSEHIRRAIDDYLDKKRQFNASPSKSVKGGKNGK